MELNLLEKTELRVQNVILDDVNLTKIAETVAVCLALPRDRVLVIDVRRDHFCLDILEKAINVEQIIGKEKELLAKLSEIPGLLINPDTYIDTRGILGLINCDEVEATAVVKRTETMLTEIEQRVLARALIYATGFEVAEGMIEDTNSPFLMEVLAKNGYKTEFGGVVEDSKGAIKLKLLEAIDRGFGLVITTGGVGAEDKDFSVEALGAIDPTALTPYIVKFEKGTGRHLKDGVRIGIGQVGLTTIINLPGPHDEVVAAAEALQRHCRCQRIFTPDLANDVATILRDKLNHKHWGHHNGQRHH
jgi:molybdenum cofactor synthesis domain-containing protein